MTRGAQAETPTNARPSFPRRGEDAERSEAGGGHAAPATIREGRPASPTPRPVAATVCPTGRRGRPRRPARFDTAASSWPLLLGLLVLAALWLGPLPERARGSFAAHMVMHMGVVAVAAPLLALGLSRLLSRTLSRLPVGFALLATLVELVAVWGWHAPVLHDAARVNAWATLAEQASFLLAGLLVWATAFGAANTAALSHKLAGAGALLLTSMHMTLLGALLLFAPRPLYACAAICAPLAAATPLEDQAAGGAIMLVAGGIAYLAGGLALVGRVLGSPAAELRR